MNVAMPVTPGPALDELEVSLIGPGYGECAVVHIGNGHWIVIDSCVNVESAQQAAIEYFESIGVNTAVQVRLIVITHWHDDHIRGITELLPKCQGATIACAAAMTESEVRRFIRTQARVRTLANTSGTSEADAALDEIKRRLANAANTVTFAQGTSRLFVIQVGQLWRCEVWSLSPSAAEFARFLTSLGNMMPTTDQTQRRIPSPEPNDVALATWIALTPTGGDDAVNMLFGSDLEEDGNPTTGWSAVLASTTKPTGTASLFKVAHHGSKTGHHRGVWTSMLTPSPFAVLTPFQLGKHMLPTTADVGRINQLTENAHISSNPTVRARVQRRDPMVDKTLKTLGVDLQSAQSPMGRVTLRKRAADIGWRATYGGAACALSTVRAPVWLNSNKGT